MRARRTATRACVALLLSLPVLAAGARESWAAPAGWDGLATEIAAPWPGLQSSSGHFADYVVRRAPGPLRDDYGDPLLGYGLLLSAARTGDAGLRDAGLRAIRYSLEREGDEAVAPFRVTALAGGYNVARERFADAPLFVDMRAAWERALKRIELTRLGGRKKLTNKAIVEAVAVMELSRTGLSSAVRGTVLNDPAQAVALAKRLLRRTLPRAARPFERSAGSAGRVAMLGDYPGTPLAYHALATGFLARATELMGDSAPSAARTLLRRGADASWALQAPDGDVGYIGRSQEQAWTLPLTAYGVEVAGDQPGGGARAGRYRAVAERAVGRLGDAYGRGREGLLVTPALGQNLQAGIRGLDPYVAAVSYNGLTLVALEWAIAAAGEATPPTGIGADGDSGFRLSAGDASFATVRAGDVWFAVKRAHSASADMRYDFGLVALKVRGAGGRWTDAMPLRPLIDRAGDSAGPLLRRHGRVGAPQGRSLTIGRDGTVTVGGGFRASGGRWLRRGVDFRFEPTACGVALTVPVRRSDRLEYSAFFSGAPSTSPGRASDATQSVTFSPGAAAHRSGGLASGSDARVSRLRLRFARPRSGKLTITTCAAR